MKWCKVISIVRVILSVKRKKIFILTVFTWFLILDKIQDGGLILYRRLKAFYWRQNRFEVLQHIKNPTGGVLSTPPPPLVPRWGYDFACTSEG